MATHPDRDHYQSLLVQKAASDPSFKNDLIRDPAAAIANEYGIEIPHHMKITVLEETADHFYVVLPPPAAASGGLADADLEAVMGGMAKSREPRGGCGCGGMSHDPTG